MNEQNHHYDKKSGDGEKKGDSFNLHRSTAPWSIYMSFFIVNISPTNIM